MRQKWRPRVECRSRRSFAQRFIEFGVDPALDSVHEEGEPAVLLLAAHANIRKAIHAPINLIDD